MDKVNLNIGDIVKVTRNITHHHFRIGTKVRIKAMRIGFDDYTCEYLDGHDYWYLKAEEFTKVGEVNV